MVGEKEELEKVVCWSLLSFVPTHFGFQHNCKFWKTEKDVKKSTLRNLKLSNKKYTKIILKYRVSHNFYLVPLCLILSIVLVWTQLSWEEAAEQYQHSTALPVYECIWLRGRVNACIMQLCERGSGQQRHI